jgi:hypothetical protein
MVITLVALAGRAIAEQPAQVPLKSAADWYAELAFGFCAAVVGHPGQQIPALAAGLPGISVSEPEPLAGVGRWSDALQSRLKAGPADKVYVAKTPATAVGAFHLAYALQDGSRCIALAQEIPGAAAARDARVKDDASYQLMMGDERAQLYDRAAEKDHASYIVILPAAANDKGVIEALFNRSNVRPRVGDADRVAWANAILGTCLRAAQSGTAISVADFGEFMEARASQKDPRRVDIVAPQRFPPSMLFVESRPAGCRLILSAGAEENEKLKSLWRGELGARGAKSAPRNSQGERFSIAKTRSGDTRLAAVSVVFSELLAGLLTVTILAD